MRFVTLSRAQLAAQNAAKLAKNQKAADKKAAIAMGRKVILTPPCIFH